MMKPLLFTTNVTKPDNVIFLYFVTGLILQILPKAFTATTNTILTDVTVLGVSRLKPSSC